MGGDGSSVTCLPICGSLCPEHQQTLGRKQLQHPPRKAQVLCDCLASWFGGEAEGEDGGEGRRVSELCLNLGLVAGKGWFL